MKKSGSQGKPNPGKRDDLRELDQRTPNRTRRQKRRVRISRSRACHGSFGPWWTQPSIPGIRQRPPQLPQQCGQCSAGLGRGLGLGGDPGMLP
jgi:hypothetical protein